MIYQEKRERMPTEKRRHSNIGDPPSGRMLGGESGGPVGGSGQGTGGRSPQPNANIANANDRKNTPTVRPTPALNPGPANSGEINQVPNGSHTATNTGNGTQTDTVSGSQTAQISNDTGGTAAANNIIVQTASPNNANVDITQDTGHEGMNSGTQPSGNGGVEGGQEGV